MRRLFSMALALVWMSTLTAKSYRVVNDEDGDGWQIYSEQTGMLIGAGETGQLDEENLPNSMVWALERLASKQQDNSLRASYREAIAPMTKSQWGQSVPYYMETPEVCAEGSSDYRHTLTGCGATALAAVVHYWQTPSETLPALESYTARERVSGGKTYAEFTVPALESTPINWGLIKNVYKLSDSLTMNGLEVSKLMRYCGQAVQMQYGVSASSSSPSGLVKALKEKFGYSQGAHIESRDDYSRAEWEELLYEELAAGRPVLMDGTDGDGGHFFVCDGYKNGLWHINWGWSGSGNGYFAMDALDGDDKSNVTNDFDDGYTYDVDVIVGVEPAGGAGGITLPDTLVRIRSLSSVVKTYTISSANKLSIRWKLSCDFKDTTELFHGVRIIDSNGSVTQNRMIKTAKKYSPGIQYPGSGIIMANFGSDYADGTYTLHFVYKDKLGNMSLAEGNESDRAHLTFTKSGNTITFAGGADTSYTINSIKMYGPTESEEKLFAYRTIRSTVNIRNDGNLNNEMVYIFLNGNTSYSGRNVVNVEHGETGDVPLTFSTVKTGVNTYVLVLCGDTLYSGAFTTQPSEKATMSYTKASDNSIAVVGEAYPHLFTTSLEEDITVKNTGSGKYNDVIYARLQLSDCGSLHSMDSKYEIVDLPASGTQKIHFGFDDLMAGETYLLRIYYYTANDEGLPTSVRFYQKRFVVDETATAAVVEVEGQPVEKEGTYDLQGRKIDAGRMGKGTVYIQNGRKLLVK